MKEFTSEWIAGAREVVGNDAASPSGQIAFIALDHIEHLQQRIAELEAERRWIQVSEGLPEIYENVLVCSGGVTIGKRKRDIVRKWVWVTIDNFLLDYVTHWQPLPQPPKEGE